MPRDLTSETIFSSTSCWWLKKPVEGGRLVVGSSRWFLTNKVFVNHIEPVFLALGMGFLVAHQRHTVDGRNLAPPGMHKTL